jgi:HhH-GPD superfamily base excision DNA repair protein
MLFCAVTKTTGKAQKGGTVAILKKRGNKKPLTRGKAKKPNTNPGRVAGILAGLDAMYPDAVCELNHENPFQLLIATILSAQCTDVRVNQVTATLFKKYRTPKDFAQANPAELEQEIRPTGFFRNKTKSVIPRFPRHAG